MLAIAALDTNFPQTIEATFSAVVALSQASALGWLDFPPDARVADILSTKAPDLTALGLTLYASWKLQNDYFNDHPGSTTTKYPPFVLRSPWLPFCVCAGVNEAVMAVVCYHWLYLRHGKYSDPPTAPTHSLLIICAQGGEPIRRSFRRLVRIASWIFALSSTTGAAIGMVLAYYGCTPFTWGLYAAPLAVVSGIIYSMFQTERRLQDFGADLEQKAQSLLSATEMNSPHRSRSGTR